MVTIHDLIHQKYEMKTATTHSPLLYKIKHAAYNFAFSNAIKNSQKIITPSEYVKNDLIKAFDVKSEKITVTYEGVEEEFIKISERLTSKKQNEILAKFNIKPPFIFYIGNAHPHKNVIGLIEAFKILRKDYQYLTLVLAGRENYFWSKILKQVHDDNMKSVIFAGNLTDEELAVFYKNAAVYVQPSFEEGFGLPVLEAFSLGCPVASSNAASLPEIGKDAAVYFEPSDIYSIAENLKKVLNEQKLRKEMIQKGRKRAEDFSFKKMAEETLKIYNS